MRKYEPEEPRDFTKKRAKHSPNRPGQGMRIINDYVLEEDYLLDLDDDVDIEDDTETEW